MPAPSSGNPIASRIADWSLNTKILAIVAVLSLVGAGIGIFAITQMAQLSRAADHLYSSSVVPTQDLEHIGVDIGGMRAATLMHAIARTEADMKAYEEAIRTGDAAFDSHLAAYRPRTADPGLLTS